MANFWGHLESWGQEQLHSVTPKLLILNKQGGGFTKTLCLEKGWNRENMPRGLHLTLPLSMMPFANLSPKPETSRLRNTPGITKEGQHGLFITPGCICIPALVPEGTFPPEKPAGPCKPPAFSWDSKRWSRSCVWQKGIPAELLSWPAPALCFPGVLQVPPCCSKPRTPQAAARYCWCQLGSPPSLC